MPKQEETPVAALTAPTQSMQEFLEGVRALRSGFLPQRIPEKIVREARAAEDPANFAGSEGWKRFRATCTAAPVYFNAVSKDGKYLYAPRFHPDKEVLVPLDAQTERYVRFGQLELADSTTHYVPAPQGEEGHFITGKKK